MMANKPRPVFYKEARHTKSWSDFGTAVAASPLRADVAALKAEDVLEIVRGDENRWHAARKAVCIVFETSLWSQPPSAHSSSLGI